MSKRSAGLLVHRKSKLGLEVLLGHMGGPFWAKKDEASWTIPKGEFSEPETALEAAMREFEEETGIRVEGPFKELPVIKQAGGKMVHAFAVEMDCQVSNFHSNTFQMEWPPGSGKIQEFPELDRLEWFPLETARSKILKSQRPLLDVCFGGAEQRKSCAP